MSTVRACCVGGCRMRGGGSSQDCSPPPLRVNSNINLRLIKYYQMAWMNRCMTRPAASRNTIQLIGNLAAFIGKQQLAQLPNRSLADSLTSPYRDSSFPGYHKGV